MYQLDDLGLRLKNSRYQTYTYSYPHKSAYSHQSLPVCLEPIWAAEDRQNLMLYIHIPFCEMKCGFCNLFSTVDKANQFEKPYLDALRRQLDAYKKILIDFKFSRVAIGGGTPTILSIGGMISLLQILKEFVGSDFHEIPCSVETSPLTANSEKLSLLREFGVSRMSMGVQSIYEEENNQLMRHQPQCVLSTALDALYQSKFECVNLDLIYGIPGQSVSSWVNSIYALLRWAPQEIFLYPLYQRPLTGLAKRYSKIERNDLYFKFYEAGKKVLEDAGYQQLSTRAFRHSSFRPSSVRAYSCQEDGMIGIGCGARSYTRHYHYSEEYSVNQSSVRAILQKYIAKSTDEFMYSHYGISLSIEDVKRRYLIQSIMQAEGLDVYRYEQCFQAAVYDDFPGIRQLLDFGLASADGRYIVLNSAGMKLGDVIGPWFMSDVVKSAVSDYIYKG